MGPVILSVITALLFALLLFVEKRIITEIKDYLSWALFASILAGAIAIVFLPLNIEWITNPLPLAVSGVSTLLGYILYLKALNRTSPSSIGILMSARPLFSTVFAIFLLGEVYSQDSLLWLFALSLAFILFSWNPVEKRDLVSSGLIIATLTVWIIGDSMIKFASSGGMWFVLGRDLFVLPVALAAFFLKKEKVTIPRLEKAWKSVVLYVIFSFSALALFFTAAQDSFAIANAVSNSLTAVFFVFLGMLAALAKTNNLGEKWSLRKYAFKTAVAGVIAVSVFFLYFSV